MLDKIEQTLDLYVRPQLSQHYGNLEVLDFKDGTLEVKLLGQCSNCPSSKYTIEHFVVQELRKYISEVKNVVLIDGVSDELLNFARKILNHENRN
ncbi:MAG: NifU family protein [Sedimentibacter sp.]